MLQFAPKQSFVVKSVFPIRIQEAKIDPQIGFVPNSDPDPE
jgi:hypothetical protein